MAKFRSARSHAPFRPRSCRSEIMFAGTGPCPGFTETLELAQCSATQPFQDNTGLLFCRTSPTGCMTNIAKLSSLQRICWISLASPFPPGVDGEQERAVRQCGCSVQPGLTGRNTRTYVGRQGGTCIQIGTPHVESLLMSR